MSPSIEARRDFGYSNEEEDEDQIYETVCSDANKFIHYDFGQQDILF